MSGPLPTQRVYLRLKARGCACFRLVMFSLAGPVTPKNELPQVPRSLLIHQGPEKMCPEESLDQPHHIAPRILF